VEIPKVVFYYLLARCLQVLLSDSPSPFLVAHIHHCTGQRFTGLSCFVESTGVAPSGMNAILASAGGRLLFRVTHVC